MSLQYLVLTVDGESAFYAFIALTISNKPEFVIGRGVHRSSDFASRSDLRSADTPRVRIWRDALPRVRIWRDALPRVRIGKKRHLK